jgi:hypothetical protein
MIEKHNMFKLNSHCCANFNLFPSQFIQLLDVFTQNVNVSWDDKYSTSVTIRSVVSKGPASCIHVP